MKLTDTYGRYLIPFFLFFFPIFVTDILTDNIESSQSLTAVRS